MEKLPEAREQLSAAVKLSPDTTEFQMDLAAVLLKMGQLEQAVATLRRFIARNPADGPAHYMLARALQQTGRAAEAGGEFQESAALNQAKHGLEQAGLLTANGIVDLRAGKIADAVSKLRKAVELKPDYPEAQFYLGIALAQSGDGAGAIPAFTAALEKRPRSSRCGRWARRRKRFRSSNRRRS
jgi:Flp pilus assembly protein TadD